MTPEIIANLKLFLPELVTLAGLILMFILDGAFPKSRENRSPLYLIVATCLLGAVATCYSSKAVPGTHLAFSGLLTVDAFGNFFRYFFCFTTAVSAYIAFGSKELKPQHRMEFSLLLLCVLFGLSLMAISSNFLMLYIGIETVSIVSFVMAGFAREDMKSNEASFKYLVFGALYSGLMIYGLSLVFGATGSLQYPVVAKFFVENPTAVPLTLNLALFLVFAGLAYKISAFPMHFWTPDVYEGSPTPVTTFFSVGPKAAGFAALLRVVLMVFSKPTEAGVWETLEGTPIVSGLALVSALTMIVGNLSAIGQTSTRRLFAYSSIAHVGYMLMGLITLNQAGVTAILFYLVAYCAMNIGAFWVVCVIHDATGTDDLDAFRGAGWNSPLLGVCMAIFLFSLTGIPMFSGFIGKFLLFANVIKTPGFVWLAIVGVLNSVVSLYYYAKILKAMWLDKPKAGSGPLQVSLYHAIGLVALAIPTIVLGLFFGPVLDFAGRSLFALN